MVLSGMVPIVEGADYETYRHLRRDRLRTRQQRRLLADPVSRPANTVALRLLSLYSTAAACAGPSLDYRGILRGSFGRRRPDDRQRDCKEVSASKK